MLFALFIAWSGCARPTAPAPPDPMLGLTTITYTAGPAWDATKPPEQQELAGHFAYVGDLFATGALGCVRATRRRARILRVPIGSDRQPGRGHPGRSGHHERGIGARRHGHVVGGIRGPGRSRGCAVRRRLRTRLPSTPPARRSTTCPWTPTWRGPKPSSPRVTSWPAARPRTPPAAYGAGIRRRRRAPAIRSGRAGRDLCRRGAPVARDATSDGRCPVIESISHAVCPFLHRARLVATLRGEQLGIRYIDLFDRPEWFGSLSPDGRMPVFPHSGRRPLRHRRRPRVPSARRHPGARRAAPRVPEAGVHGSGRGAWNQL